MNRSKGPQRGGKPPNKHFSRSNKERFFDRTRTSLPKKLLDELGAAAETADPADKRFARPGGFRNKAKSRKESRKAERADKKRRADEFHRQGQHHKVGLGGGAPELSDVGYLQLKPGNKFGETSKKNDAQANGLGKRPLDGEHAEGPAPKKPKSGGQGKAVDAELEARRLAKFAAKNPELYHRLQKDRLVSGALVSAEQTRLDDDEDDRDMKRYAKLLGIKMDGKKAKKLPSSFRTDGFADILEELGGFKVAGETEAEGGEPTEEANDEEDFEELEGVDDSLEGAESDDDQSGEEEDDDLENVGEDSDVSADLDDDEELSYGSDLSSDEDGEGPDDEDEEIEGSSEESDGDDQAQLSDPDQDTAPTTKTATTPAKTGAYIPPHLRGKDPKQSEKYQRLKRHLRGQLNRLTDANMESIFGVAEEAYRTNPRHDVTEIITDSILDYIVDQASLLESFVLTQAAFVALIHNLVGQDIASHIAEAAIQRFLDTYEVQKEAGEDEQGSKTCLNLVTFLAYMYNIRVLSCVVVYDLVREFIAKLSPLDVELLLRVLKISGYHLRSDDPSALKDIVLDVQAKAKDRPKGEDSFRLNFMIETIIDLKNNKRKLAANQGDDLERLRKFVQNMGKKRMHPGSEPLRFGLKDLREADKKGKWWITGAAWVGRQVGDDAPRRELAEDREGTPSATAALLDLARKVGMNTDVRRNIFVALMSSEDYADAVEKLLKLKLKDKQDREIARVIVLCAAQERVHNPYYELVAARFCSLSHGHKITFQYVLWDEVKSAADSEVRRISNVGKLYAHLIAVKALSVSVLKAIPFETLSPKQLLLMRILFHAVLMHPIPAGLDLDGYLNGIFGTLPVGNDFDALKTAIGIFLSKYMLSSDKSDAVVKANERAEVEARSKKARKILRGRNE